MAVPAFVGVAEARNGAPEGTTSLTVSVPSGAAGDLLVAVVGVKENPTLATPSGWTPIIAGFNQCTSGIDSSIGIRAQISTFYKVADGSETSLTFTWGNQVIKQASGAVLRYAGADATDPIDACGCDKGTSSSPTAPSITTTTPDTRVLRAAVSDADDAKSTFTSEPPTKRFEIESTSVFGPGSSYTTDAVVTAGSDESQTAAGATGTAAWSLPSAEQWAAQTVAIRSAEVGAGQEGCARAIAEIIRRVWESIVNGIRTLFNRGSESVTTRREARAAGRDGGRETGARDDGGTGNGG